VAQADPPGRVGRLNYSNGPVSLRPAGMTDWLDADVNRPLTTDDQIWVGDGGHAEIHVGSTALRLNSNTAFQFLNLDDQTIQIQLSEGAITVRVRNLPREQNLEIDTPSLAFTVLQPGEYRIGADADAQTATVTVRSGAGEVTGGGRTFPVGEGQQAIIAGGDQATYRLVSAPRADAWDQWSASRDRREEESRSARYVSREMNGYDDLDRYGNWADQPGYGQVWMPTGLAGDWAPYHDGYWAWISPWGWTWVDNAPWGFAPYHYGRWASFEGRWGWVPGPSGTTPLYAPALVAWVGGGGFSLSFSSGNAAAVGWFPLGPSEPYFPSYNVSSAYFGRVNRTNTTITNVTINNYYSNSRDSSGSAFNNIRYANRDVRNAIVAVPQERFSDGRHVSENARAVSAAQLGSARFAAAPAVAPQRASVLGPAASQPSRAPRPPDTILNRPVVARTAPPPAPAAFDRQQVELNRNPGRPLPAATVQQLGRDVPTRRSPVRVEDMQQVQRVQPVVGGAPQQGTRPANPGQPPSVAPRPLVAPPSTDNNRQIPADRQNNRPVPPIARPNAAPQPQAAPPSTDNNRQSPADRLNNRPMPQVSRPIPAPQPQAAPPPTDNNRQNPADRQNNRPVPQVSRPIPAPQPQAAPPPADNNRQRPSQGQRTPAAQAKPDPRSKDAKDQPDKKDEKK
jgi:hypothetical protein